MKALSSLIRQPVQALSPISWGQSEFDASALILKWGENPYSPPSQIVRSVQDSLNALNRYPTLMSKLKSQLAEYTGVDSTQITLVNGLDKAFRLLAEVCINPGDEVITFAPSYPVIDSVVEIMGGKMKVLPLQFNFCIPKLEEIAIAVTPGTKAIYICNPNNPTGKLMATNDQLEALLQLGPLVIVDEAYFEFAQATAANLLAKYQNLIIMRSFSKTFGLAGLRVGYLLSSSELAGTLAKVEETIEIFNISTPSLAGASAALEYISEYQLIWKRIAETRTKLQNFLESYGLSPTPSLCSFILFNTQELGVTSKEFLEKMREKNIILKDCSLYQGLSPYAVYSAIPKQEDLPKLETAIINIINNIQSVR
jgi:histidinol-phosphate aminotransferase